MSEELPITTQTILDKAPKREIMKAMNGITKAIALQSDHIPSMAALCRKFGDEKVEQVVGMFIQDTSVFVGAKMPKAVALDCAVEIMNKYPYRSLKLEEIYIICMEIKEKDNFGDLTPNKMLVAVKRFWKDREKRAIKHSVDQSQGHKYDTELDDRIHKSVRMPDKVNKIIAQKRAYHNQKFLK